MKKAQWGCLTKEFKIFVCCFKFRNSEVTSRTAVIHVNAHYYVYTVTLGQNSVGLKVHKIENFFDSDFGICVISLLGMSKY
jgi:hypothetical protein